MYKNIYNHFAEHFNVTRYSVWEYVSLFINDLDKYSCIADIGSGNGKHLTYRKDITVIGNDISIELLNITSKKIQNTSNDVVLADGLYLPYLSNSFDSAISIAVLHHIDNINDRIKFIKEMVRIVKPNKKILFSVWASEQEIKPKWKKINDNNDYSVPWLNRKDNIEYLRYYHLFSKNELDDLLTSLNLNYILIYDHDNWFITIIK